MRTLYPILAFATVALLAVATATGAFADGGKKHFKAELSGYDEVPAISTTGSGTFDASIDEGTTTITYALTYAGLEGTATTAAHIHFGQPNANGGVSAFLCGGDKPACTPGSGTFTGTIEPADIVGPSAQGIAPGEWAELVQAIRGRVTYANVHTNKHPGGEIRGQLR